MKGYAYDFISYLPLLALAFGIVAAFALLARWVSSWDFLFNRLAPNPFLHTLLQQFVKVAIYLLGVLLALDLLDATRAVGTVLGAAGLISLAVSFALRDSVENYITSILLSLRQPFAPNDHVLIEGQEGRVARLTSRATILLTLDGDTVRIPNSTVFKATIVNYSRNPLRRFNFIVGVAPDAALLAAQQLALDTLSGMDGVLADPPPICLVHGLGDYSINLFVAGWIDQDQADFLKVKSEAIRLITQAFAAADIDVPDPTYNIRLQRKPSIAKKGSAAPGLPRKVAIDISRDDALDRQVAKDRQRAKDTNLLDTAAPKE
ncbi:mechanosensitive ion channel domain-containing protein [Accumulibacter sp.]|uniref:mechanosensitive ion channel family protein n=1 Tax=Accumulibacter sp. TaxID=2053492 RepID=UPI002B7B44E5|nr:mechanosensitive ion channel domain-containing protein [Accumulibacter sp.]HRF06972.1 mechanosensitive ion channel [Accumulibacter sp.]